jgi:hypothetical protein
MSLYLSQVCFTKADYVQILTPGCKYHRVQSTIDKAKGSKTPFTVIFAIVFENDSLAPVHIGNQTEWQSAFGIIFSVFVVVKGNAHG